MTHKIDFSSIVKMQSYAKHFTTATVAHSGVTVNELSTLTTWPATIAVTTGENNPNGWLSDRIKTCAPQPRNCFSLI